MKDLCYNCKYCVYDSLADGYCNNRQRKEEREKQNLRSSLVMIDSGCLVEDCKYFEQKDFENE